MVDWDGQILSVPASELDNGTYHKRPEISRSYAHSIYRFGGRGQQLLERGVRLVSGNAGITRGSQFDALWEARASGKSLTDVFAVPPASVLASDGSKRGKPYAEWASQQTAEIASQSDLDTLSLMWEGVELCDRAMELLAATSDCQRSVFWTDDAGHRRKARFDGQTSELIYDVKTTSSPWEMVHKSCLEYGYLWQAHWYREAAYQIDYGPFAMPFVFVQSVPPYECRVFTFPESLVAAAGQQIATTLDLIKFRRETGEYLPPQYGEEEELSFPAWVYLKEDVHVSE